jgi:hypothetical protein
MRGTGRAILAGLAITVALGGCAPRARDIDMGTNRYLVTVNGNSYAGFGSVEEAFQARAREVASAHGFDSYRVSEYSTSYTITPLGLKPTARGTRRRRRRESRAAGRQHVLRHSLRSEFGWRTPHQCPCGGKLRRNLGSAVRWKHLFRHSACR